MGPARVLALAVVVAGCTHHRPLANVSEATGEIVKVETTSGDPVTAYAHATPQGFILVQDTGNEVPASSVVRVIDKRRAHGAFEGFMIAGGAGVAFGALLGLSSGDDHCSDFCLFELSAGDKAVLGGFVFGSLGAFVGLIAGAIVGSDYVYSNESRTRTIMPLGPPGSTAGLTLTF